jgi:hypothetical protein
MRNVYDEMSDQELHRAAQNMERYGGGFATAIAKAFYVADTDNRRLLLGAFGHLFEDYASARWENSGETKAERYERLSYEMDQD